MLVSIYIDGATYRSNPAPCGSGLVMYHDDLLVWKKAIPIKEPGTNNIAEVYAVIVALEYIQHYHQKGVEYRIISDSSYVVNGFNKWSSGWVKKGWVNVKNDELWKTVVSLKKKLKEKKVKYKVLWTKGHAGTSGNEEADRMASLAAKMAFEGKYDEIHIEDMQSPKTKSDTKTTIAKKSKKTHEIHPFLRATSMYYNTLNIGKGNDNKVYYLSESIDNDDLIGRVIPDSALCIAKLNQSDVVLDNLITTQTQWIREHKPDGYEVNCAVSLNALGISTVYPVLRERLENEPTDCLYVIDDFGSMNIRSDIIEPKATDKPKSKLLDPPYLFSVMLDYYNHMHDKVDLHRNGKYKGGNVLDISSYFYETNDKGKCQLASTINSTVKYMDIKEGKSLIRLNLGTDICSRNVLKKIEKHYPKVELFIWSISETMIQYMTMITLDNGEYCVYYSPYLATSIQ